MVEQTQTTTPAGGAGKLPIDRVGNLPPVQAATPAPTEAKDGVKAPVIGAEGTAPPAAKTYTEEEYNKQVDSIKAGHKGTVDKMRTDLAGALLKLEEAGTRQAEQGWTDWLKRVESDGGDVNQAKQIVERERAIRTRESEYARQNAELQTLQKDLNEAGIRKAAFDLSAQYELGKESVDELLKSETKDGMRARALELALEKAKAGAVPPEKTDKGQGSQQGIDVSKLPLSTRLGMAAEKQI